MATRKIKDAKDLSTNELVYFKGHAKATYMSDGRNVEEAIHQISTGEGGITAETDPVFSASPAATITEEDIVGWNLVNDLNTDVAQLMDTVQGKQDTIADLATIRSGAEKGATALQSVPSEYGTKTWVTEQARDIANDAVGDFEAVAVEPLAVELSTLREDFDTLVSGDTTTAIKTFNEVIAFLDGLTDTQDLESIIASIEQQIAGKMDNVTLAKVATSGSYNDLSNKPTIPSAVTESTVSGWGFTKNTGTYSKPSGGIPKNDLSSAVQASLDRADAAVPIYTLADSVYAEANGVADEQFVYALPSSANGDEDDIIVTRNTLKTINGESLVGSGDITISGGGSGYAGNYPVQVVSQSLVDITLQPNVFYRNSQASLSAVKIKLASPTNQNIVNEYLFEWFQAGICSVSLPSSVVWANDDMPDFEEEYTYVLSIVDNIAICTKTAGNVIGAQGGGGGSDD